MTTNETETTNATETTATATATRGKKRGSIDVRICDELIIAKIVESFAEVVRVSKAAAENTPEGDKAFALIGEWGAKLTAHRVAHEANTPPTFDESAVKALAMMGLTLKGVLALPVAVQKNLLTAAQALVAPPKAKAKAAPAK